MAIEVTGEQFLDARADMVDRIDAAKQVATQDCRTLGEKSQIELIRIIIDLEDKLIQERSEKVALVQLLGKAYAEIKISKKDNIGLTETLS